MKQGVKVLPVSRVSDAVEVKALPAQNELTGEDETL